MATDKGLNAMIKLQKGKRNSFDQGVEYTYSSSLKFVYKTVTVSKEVSLTYSPSILSDRGDFSELFNHIAKKSMVFSSILNLGEKINSKIITEDEIMECLLSLRNQVNEDFFTDTGNWSKLKPELYKQYFKSYEPRYLRD